MVKEGCEFTIDTDMVIIAIGSGANPLLTRDTKDLGLNRRGYIVADANGRTTRQGVWAAGDIVTGSATVILAMGAGKAAAQDIDRYLANGNQHANEPATESNGRFRYVRWRRGSVFVHYARVY